MRNLIFILFVLTVFVGCAKEDDDGLKMYTVKEGENTFHPIKPILPFNGFILSFKVSFDSIWFDTLCTQKGYGLKLPAVGKYNYHEGGANYQGMYENGGLWLSARYYEEKEAPYILHVLDNMQLKADRIYDCRIVFWNDKTDFVVDGVLLSTADVGLPHSRIAPSFIGRSGKDTGYNINNPPAYAKRDLTLRIKIQ